MVPPLSLYMPSQYKQPGLHAFNQPPTVRIHQKHNFASCFISIWNQVTNTNRPQREEHRSRVFKNRVLRKIFGPKQGEVSDDKKIAYQGVSRFHSSRKMIRAMKTKMK
jgi:hypothetical protein